MAKRQVVAFCVDGLSIQSDEDGEPRVRDLDLAKRLGFKQPRNIRKLIKRLVEDGEIADVITRATVERVIAKAGSTRAVEVEETRGLTRTRRSWCACTRPHQRPPRCAKCKACAAGVPPEPSPWRDGIPAEEIRVRIAGITTGAPASSESFTVAVSLPIHTRNPNNGTTGHSRLASIIRSRERAGIRNGTRLTVEAHVRAAGVHPTHLLPVRVTVTRLSSGTLDKWDGLGAALKPVIDGVADVFQLRDDNPAFTWVLDQRKVKRGIYGVEIRIERMAPK